MNPTTDGTNRPPDARGSSASAVKRPKPGLALFIATSLGLGYLPKAPGTWGSVMGVALAWVAMILNPAMVGGPNPSPGDSWAHFAIHECILFIAISVVGVWAAGKAAEYAGREDPQFVVVDEVAGQLIAYLGLATPRTFAVSWKYLVVGFILFRGFDIWKPSPARQAEALPGGWGIMADDWIAGVYAAIVLGAIRMMHLL